MAEKLGSLIIEKNLTVRETLKLAAFTTPGQLLSIVDNEGTVGITDSGTLQRVQIDIIDESTGTVYGDFNASSTLINVGVYDLVVIKWLVDDSFYLFIGNSGLYGSGGSLTALPANFVAMGEAGIGGAVEFPDSAFRVYKSTDPSAKIQLDATAIQPFFTRKIIMPDYDVDLGALPGRPLSGSGSPAGIVVARYKGDLYVDTSTTFTYMFNGTWKRTDNIKNQQDTVDPAVTNDSSEGYEVFSLWYNKTAGTLFYCIDTTVGAAVWNAFGDSSDAFSPEFQDTSTLAVFDVGDPVTWNGSVWALADNGAEDTCGQGIVTEVLVGNIFKATTVGQITIPGAGFTPKTWYYLDGLGQYTSVEPAEGELVQLMFFAITNEIIAVDVGTPYTQGGIDPGSGDGDMLRADYAVVNANIVDNALGVDTGLGQSKTAVQIVTHIDDTSIHGPNPSGLEAIDEGNGVGWRVIGRDPAYYGGIGENAVDFGQNGTTSTVFGATGASSLNTGWENIARGWGAVTHGSFNQSLGNYSFISGYGNISDNLFSVTFGHSGNNSAYAGFVGGFELLATNHSQFVAGRDNAGSNLNTIAEIGIGGTAGTRANGLEVYGVYSNDGSTKNTHWGAVVAPEMTNTVIDTFSGAVSDRVLITKEYADSNYVTGGGAGDMLKSVYDTGDNTIVDRAEQLEGPGVAANISTAFDVRTHLDSLLLHLTSDERAAIDGTPSAPTAGNTFATQADLVPGPDYKIETFPVTQVTHGFAIGDAVVEIAGTWQAADTSVIANAAEGIVMSVEDADNFRASTLGKLTLTAHGLALDEWFYLLAGGTFSSTPPAIDGEILQACFKTLDVNTIYVRVFQPTVLGASGDMLKSDYATVDANIVDAALGVDDGGGINVKTALEIVTHIDDTDIHVTSDQSAALDGANAPSVSNVVATINDISSFGVGDMLKADYATADPNIVDSAFELHDGATAITSALSVYDHLNGDFVALHFSTDERAAMDAANIPSAINAIATMDDIAAAGGGDMLKANYATANATIVDAALNVDDGAGKTKTAAEVVDHIDDILTNPHAVTKAQVGLSVAENTTDLDKPISTATQTALDLKEDDLGSPTTDGDRLSSTTGGARSWVAPSTGVLHSGISLDDGTNPHATTKADVGLSVAENTTDLDKPISTATQSALDLKEDDLGNPLNDGDILSSTIAGARSWATPAGLATGLETVTEATNTGWRLVGRDPLNYGDIGDGAIDMSYSDTASSVYGATETGAFAVGYRNQVSSNQGFVAGANNIVSGNQGAAFGLWNTVSGSYGSAFGWFAQALETGSNAQGIYTIAQNEGSLGTGIYNIGTESTTIVEVGIGVVDSTVVTEFNGLEIHGGQTNSWSDPLVQKANWGAVVAPEMSNSVIDNFASGTHGNDGRVLITKDYADANYSTSGGTMSSWFVRENGGTGVEITDAENLDFIDGFGTLPTVVSQTDPTVTFDLNYGAGSNIVDIATDELGTSINTKSELLYKDFTGGLITKGYVEDLPFSNNSGDITRVNITAGVGLTGTVDTTSGAHTQTLDISLGTLSTGTGLTGGSYNGTSSPAPWAVDLSELSEKTGDVVGTDRLAGVTGGVNWSETISNIPLSIFDDANIMYDNVVNSYTKTQYFAATSDAAPGATHNIDLDSNQVHVMTLSANVTITVSNIKAGATYIIIIKQPVSAGPYTVAWPSEVYWPGDVDPIMTATDDRADVYTFVGESTSKMYGSYNQNYDSGTVL